LLTDFVAKFSTVVDIGLQQNLFSVISYGRQAFLRFGLTKHIDRPSLLRAINAVPYTGGNTNTAAALKILQDHSLLGLRDGYRHVVIVITDGLSGNSVATAVVASDLHSTNVYDIFSIGVANARAQELLTIASREENVFLSDNFAAATLEEFAKEILLISCSSKYCNIL